MVLDSFAEEIKTKAMVFMMRTKTMSEFLADDIQAEENHLVYMEKTLSVV